MPIFFNAKHFKAPTAETTCGLCATFDTKSSTRSELTKTVRNKTPRTLIINAKRFKAPAAETTFGHMAPAAAQIIYKQQKQRP